MSWPSFGRLLRDDGPLGGSLAAVVLAVAWVATWRPQVDPDAWWHLALGESITATGAVPTIEPFSWLTAGDRFVAHSWLFDLIFAWSWRMAGATGTSLLLVPVAAVIIWLVWALVGLVAPGVPPLGRALLVLGSVLVVLPLWAPRAQTLDVAFVLATVLVSAHYLHRGTRRGLLALPVLGVLWANLHGSAVLALGVCVVIALVALPVGVRWGTWPRRSARPLVLAGLAGLAGAVLNPYGPGLLAYPFDRDVASAFTPAIVEWRSPDFGAAELWPVRALLAGLLLVAVWLPVRSRDPFLLLAAAGWTFAALGAVRFLSIAAPLLFVAVAPAIGIAASRWLGLGAGLPGITAIDEADGTVTEAPSASSGSPPSIRDARLAVAIAAVAIGLVLAAGWLIVAPDRQDAAIARRMPVAAVAALAGGECTARILPAYGWAGYVAWSTGEPVGAYGSSAEAAVEGQARVEAVLVDPRPWLDEHAVGAVLVAADGPLAHWLDEADGWRLAYRDTQATLHVRADRTDCAVKPPAAP